MWVSVEQPEQGGQISLDMDDGDTSGQQVYISREWLWGRGIHRPVAVDEDGTNLSVERTLQGDGWMIDMHHFTYIEITATDQLVFSRQDGIIVPHTQVELWGVGSVDFETLQETTARFSGGRWWAFPLIEVVLGEEESNEIAQCWFDGGSGVINECQEGIGRILF